MPATDTYSRARIDDATEQRARKVLAGMGLSLSDAINLFMLYIADRRRLPFEIKAPNKETMAAIAELEAGKGESFDSVDGLMTDLNADDSAA